ncbi:MAG: GNAT family N-acetyltransferase [Pseudonocardiaceae bacterium]
MIIRRAVIDDLPTIVELRRERAAWLADIGSDQWSVGLTERGFRQRVQDSIQAGETWMATADDGRVVGTIAIDQWTNPGLWSQAELADAVIVHRMITRRCAAGQGIGQALLAHTDRFAIDAGRRWVRLDAWTSNHGLHRYYEHAGFRHVRTVADYPSRSTALFEREVSMSAAQHGALAQSSRLTLRYRPEA